MHKLPAVDVSSYLQGVVRQVELCESGPEALQLVPGVRHLTCISTGMQASACPS